MRPCIGPNLFGLVWEEGRKPLGLTSWLAVGLSQFGPYFGPKRWAMNWVPKWAYMGLNFRPIGWAKMGLVSKEWAWVERNGLRRCKGAE